MSARDALRAAFGGALVLLGAGWIGAALRLLGDAVDPSALGAALVVAPGACFILIGAGMVADSIE